jgi:hypothetical protein
MQQVTRIVQSLISCSKIKIIVLITSRTKYISLKEYLQAVKILSRKLQVHDTLFIPHSVKICHV